MNEFPEMVDAANTELADNIPAIAVAGHVLIDLPSLLDLIATMHDFAIEQYNEGAGERALAFAMPLTILHQGLSLSLLRAELGEV